MTADRADRVVPTGPRRRPPTEVSTPGQPLLEAVEVTKHFKVGVGKGKRATVHAAENISVALHPGTVTAVVGESGSGKSTLARMLARAYQLTSGTLYLDGKEIDPKHKADKDYRGAVQLVLQDPFSSLNPVHQVRYILARPLQLHGLAGDDLERASSPCCARSRLSPPNSSSTSSRTSCPAASGNASRSPGAWRYNPGCCSPTNRFRCSTSRSVWASSTCWPTCGTRTGWRSCT